MSFSAEIKNELCRESINKKCCAQAEICGILFFGGVITEENGVCSFRFTTESKAVTERCYCLFNKVTEGEFFPLRLVTSVTKRGFVYTVSMEIESELAFGKGTWIYRAYAGENDCCKKAFMRGAFLGAGSVTNPMKAYHAELVTHHKKLCEGTVNLLAEAGFVPRLVMRKSNYVIYFKSGDEIEDFLTFLGATASMMEFANARIYKDTKNNINRKINCETANTDKIYGAAINQMKAINKLKAAGKFVFLPEKLQDTANLRCENPEASLAELSALSVPRVSKSGISHRLKRLEELAELLVKKDEK